MRRRLALGLVAAAVARPGAVVRAQTTERIRIATTISESITSLYYALKNGLFARAGLAVEIVEMSSGAAATTSVVTGNNDVGQTNVISAFSAHVRNIPIAIVAPSVVNSERNPFALLQIPADAATKTGADLGGKTCASPALGDINSLATKAWIDKNGGDSRSARFVEIPNVALEAALQQHRIDAAILQSPLLDASLAAGTSKTLGYAYGAIAPRFMGVGFVARRDWAEQHADPLRRFVRVLEGAHDYVNGHPAETVALVAEVTKIELGKVEKMHRTFNGTSLEPALIQPVIDVAAKYGTLAHPFPAAEVLWT